MFVYVIYWATLSGIPILRTALEKPNWFEWSAGLKNLFLQCFTGEGKLGKVSNYRDGISENRGIEKSGFYCIS